MAAYRGEGCLDHPRWLRLHRRTSTAPHTASAALTTSAIHDTDIATAMAPSCTCPPCTILTRYPIATAAKMDRRNRDVTPPSILTHYLRARSCSENVSNPATCPSWNTAKSISNGMQREIQHLPRAEYLTGTVSLAISRTPCNLCATSRCLSNQENIYCYYSVRFRAKFIAVAPRDGPLQRRSRLGGVSPGRTTPQRWD